MRHSGSTVRRSNLTRKWREPNDLPRGAEQGEMLLRFFSWRFVGIPALALLVQVAFAETDFRPKPVVVVTIDTLRADHLPMWGRKDIQTPTLQTLAREGIVFEQAPPRR